MQFKTDTIFGVRHCFKDKPTTTRYYKTHGYETFEEVLLEHLQDISRKHFIWDFSDPIVASHFQVKRLEANAIRCLYSIEYRKMYGDTKKIHHQMLEVECLYNQGNVDILEQEYDFEPFQESSGYQKRTKKVTKWLMEERVAIRRFLFFLKEAGSLEELKKKNIISKATYYRNLKYCEDKGYIVGGKIVRKLET